MEHEQQHPTGPTFDTLKAAEALQKAGFSDMQAKAVIHSIVESQDNLATKADIRELRTDFQALRTEFKAEFKAQRADSKRMEGVLQANMKRLQEGLSTLRWLILVAIAVMGIFVALFGILITRALLPV